MGKGQKRTLAASATPAATTARKSTTTLLLVTVVASLSQVSLAFTVAPSSLYGKTASPRPLLLQQRKLQIHHQQATTHSRSSTLLSATRHSLDVTKTVASAIATGVLAASLFFFAGADAAFAENELSAKYGGGLDTSLVDQTCLVDKCSVQAKACLADDPSCRKGLTCTAKCLGDNACITGCMARYGNNNLDNLLKCTIEDNECIKVAILPGGADAFGQEPRSPAATVRNFDPRSLQGSWYKVVGYNPNYDCYACQRNTFSPIAPSSGNNAVGGTQASFVGLGSAGAPEINKLRMDVEFSMPHLLPDGSPPPPSSIRESILLDEERGLLSSASVRSIGLNDYHTHETMIFDQVPSSNAHRFVLHKAGGATNNNEDELVSYSRTAHSEGEMFGLKFWENWYIIGENDPGAPQEFKFIYYNGKTRQNTYEGAFVYSRTKELSAESLEKVYKIALEAGMNPQQFCKIRNGCFRDETVVKEPETGLGSPSNPFRGILASTRISELLGVEPVAAQDMVARRNTATASVLTPQLQTASDEKKASSRPWWYEVGDYLENPHRHFEAMDKLRVPMQWPEDIAAPQK